MLTQR
jgi:hypothetical protein